MKVSPQKPFQLVYSLFQHQYLGYLFESFVVEVNESGKLTLRNQNISSLNAHEFASGIDDSDFELIKLMDSMQQESVIKKFYHRKVLPAQFFNAVYHSSKKDEALQAEIHAYLEKKRNKVLSLLPNKEVYEMAKDGDPTYRKLEVKAEKATVRFHFFRNENDTQYYPTIKYKNDKIEFKYRNGIILCDTPAWLMVDGKVYSFEKGVDGKKLKPFLWKKFISIPKSMEETYYEKFVAPLIETFDVFATGGINIITEKHPLIPELSIASYEEPTSNALFNKEEDVQVVEKHVDSKIMLSLNFRYGDNVFPSCERRPVVVKMKPEAGEYFFRRVKRDLNAEKDILEQLKAMGLLLNNGKTLLDKSVAFDIIGNKSDELEAAGIVLLQKKVEKRFFVGKSSISVDISEDRDWFDIKAKVHFGKYEIPFLQLRKLIIKNKREFELPNGEIAVIPESWFTRYADLFHFVHENEEKPALHKHHLALVQELKAGNLAEVTMSNKLNKLKNFDKIDETVIAKGFKGKLRPYQKAGYNWLNFLSDYNFGGCLADDMGLGKTVQTLALLQKIKENEKSGATLLIMPTSLLYNWEMEAKKFTPKLKVFSYTGTNRNKNIANFDRYDLVLTSYGIIRVDVDILEKYFFNYIILDESQVIKNPSSIIAQSVNKLKSRRKIILTGTPIENTTLDLWSQMNFVNPGLLGSEKFFKKEYQIPIERKKDPVKMHKLHALIKPFVLRRHKSQVAKDLPEKTEKIQYVSMTTAQEKEYEEAKSFYRNKILDEIESNGMAKSQMVLLQGLTMLRQIANHPKMVNQASESSSGKLEDLMYMLETALDEDHKILIFSQFVKHLNIVRDELGQKNIRYAYLDGATKDRQGEVNNFQTDKDLKVFLISLKAGGLGLNLTAADYVFILDPWWNPAIEQQAIDRAHRIGQVNKVFTYKFIAKNTVEEKILALQGEKLKLATDLITTEESFIKKLNKEDIKSLLD
ncbi:MAG: DEAD/DEAH box helicase [Bacteroidota bacterium]